MLEHSSKQMCGTQKQTGCWNTARTQDGETQIVEPSSKQDGGTQQHKKVGTQQQTSWWNSAGNRVVESPQQQTK
jgi:hypothetical protein